MNRKTFLQLLGALPFAMWKRPEPEINFYFGEQSEINCIDFDRCGVNESDKLLKFTSTMEEGRLVCDAMILQRLDDVDLSLKEAVDAIETTIPSFSKQNLMGD